VYSLFADQSDAYRQYLVRDAGIRHDYDAIRDLETQKRRYRPGSQVKMAEEAVSGRAMRMPLKSGRARLNSMPGCVPMQLKTKVRIVASLNVMNGMNRIVRKAKKIDKKKFGTLLLAAGRD
jgi:hypothetical protein